MDASLNDSVALADIRAAQRRISPHVLRTPLVFNASLSDQLGCRLHFKCENLQHAGVFKVRGATNAVLSLTDEQARHGVVTHSSGNHAAALARAAQIRGVPAHIVMPHNSRPNKLAAVRAYGVEPVLCEPTAESRHATAEALQHETGATLIHPYDNAAVIAGQGTVGLEIAAQLEDVECVVVPVGGGGLLAGVLIALKSLRPEVRVYAAEPQWADDAARSMRSGRIEQPTRYDTIADGLRTPLGELTFPILRSLLDEVLLVSEDAIIRATRAIATQARLIAEPSGAASLAAVMEYADRFHGQRVVTVISGGNLDPTAFDWS
ncbi:MAG: threonine/serine dehydratase [Planctomycetota bacterium]|nr:MAG: threonine/serine dehydratase [Planctomycetota bacterium]